jgi:hypothetical protein
MKNPLRIINMLSVYEKGDILCANSPDGTETCTHLVIEKLGFKSQQG